MPVEKSAGAVVFHREKDGAIKYLLLKHRKGYWNFPKGLIEKGEKPEEAAHRECREETGLKDLTLLPDFKETIRYFFRVKYDYQLERGFKMGDKVLKFVTYFLTEARNEEIKISFEHEDFAWLDFRKALERLKRYSVSQQVLKKADNFLNRRNKS